MPVREMPAAIPDSRGLSNSSHPSERKSENAAAPRISNSSRKKPHSAYPGESFSGLQLICLMYAGFKRIAPEQDTGMDLNDPWITLRGCLIQESLLRAISIVGRPGRG
jgi:hypothetical protein